MYHLHVFRKFTFQFQNGAIESIAEPANAAMAAMFQFQNGAIERFVFFCFCNQLKTFQFQNGAIERSVTVSDFTL